MSPDAVRNVAVLDDLDRVEHDVEMIVASVRQAGHSCHQLDSLEVDALLHVARVRRHLVDLGNARLGDKFDQAS